jgi:thioredoxin 1
MPLARLRADAFEGDRLLRPGIWAIGFLADWCPYCRAFVPALESLAGGGAFEVAVGDVTDEESPLWERFSIDVVPTVVVFRDGRPAFRRDGRLGIGLTGDDLRAIRSELKQES